MTDVKANIVITDDHVLFRKGMRALFEDSDFIGSIHEAGNGKELIDHLNKTDSIPDIILLDIQMPVMDGIEAQKYIRHHFPQIKILILTMEDDEQFMLHLISEGVNGYLLKNSEPDELEAAILKVLKQGFYFPAEMSHLVVKGAMQRGNSINSLPEFTQKEIAVLEYICKEFTAPEIAEKMHVSVRTVEGYRGKLLEKSGSKNVAGLVVYAIKNVLVKL